MIMLCNLHGEPQGHYRAEVRPPDRCGAGTIWPCRGSVARILRVRRRNNSLWDQVTVWSLQELRLLGRGNHSRCALQARRVKRRWPKTRGASVSNLAADEKSLLQSGGQSLLLLRRARGARLRYVARRLCCLSRLGLGQWIPGRSVDRPSGQRRTLRARQLPVGHRSGTNDKSLQEISDKPHRLIAPEIGWVEGRIGALA